MTLNQPALADECDAAIAWWRAAGVDCDFADDATAWLSPPEQGAAPVMIEGRAAAPGALPAAAAPQRALRGDSPPAPIPLRRDLLGDSPPTDLAAFPAWWMGAPGIDTARAYPRVPPRGAAGAALMVLVPQPEADDRERLLSGPQGRLLANILAAIGIAEDAAYVAAALPCHTPMADLAALAAGGMDAVTAHHIALVRPARLIAFGTGLTAMLGAGPQADLREINYSGRTIPLLTSETLDALMDMPRLKARFWRRWMEWSASE